MIAMPKPASLPLLVPAILPAPAPTARDYLSFSAIRTYQNCPLRYFFRYIAGLPEQTVSASLVFGSGIHRAIERHFQEQLSGNPVPTLTELLAAYESEWTDRGEDLRFFDQNERVALSGTAERMLTAFQGHAMSQPTGKILAVEETLRGPVIPGLPDLLGRVDLIVEEWDALVIHDWKTSRSRWTADQVEDAAEQLLLYAELASDFVPGKQVRLAFSVLTKTKMVSIDQHQLSVMPQQAERMKRVVERVWDAIKAEIFYPSPSSMGCAGCPFRGPCQAWPG
jgi:RecB family exonuclease